MAKQIGENSCQSNFVKRSPDFGSQLSNYYCKKDDGNVVIPGKEQQVWIRIDRPKLGGFSLHNRSDIDHVLTAVNDSLQITGTKYILIFKYNFL